MLRKLFVVAALVLTTAAATSSPAPAIDFICNCQVCSDGTGPGCRDPRAGYRFTSCSAWWAVNGSHCP
jgi:prenyltransferase beta subunit